MNSLNNENAKEGGEVKFWILVAIPLKSPDFDENMILPHVPCGHFALGTLSET